MVVDNQINDALKPVILLDGTPVSLVKGGMIKVHKMIDLGSTEVSGKFQKLFPSDVKEWSVDSFVTKFLPKDAVKELKEVFMDSIFESYICSQCNKTLAMQRCN